jgi:hypothetical protein
MFDIHAAIAAARRGHQEIRLADAPADRISRQSTIQDEELTARHRRGSRRLRCCCVFGLYDDSTWVKLKEFGNHVGFKLPATLEATLQNG